MIFKPLPGRLSNDEIDEMLEAADSDGQVTKAPNWTNHSLSVQRRNLNNIVNVPLYQRIVNNPKLTCRSRFGLKTNCQKRIIQNNEILFFGLGLL